MALKRRQRSPHHAIFGVIVSGVVSIICSLSMIGKPAHLVQIITLFASGLTCGISLNKAARDLNASPPPSDLSAPPAVVE
jgi:hypothetical protein